MSEAAYSQSQEPAGDKRERSSIEFPYMALDEAIGVAKAIHSTVGSGLCHADQLAAALNLSMASSGFRVRLSTTKMFGLIESERGSGGVRLTDLGHEIIDPSHERKAKVVSFLNVPLYRQMVEMHRGKQLPPPAALERMMADIGVAKKQTDRARQTFERSAASAGFFEFGRDKLVMPTIIGTGGSVPSDRAPAEVAYAPAPQYVAPAAEGTGDPVVDAMIKKLPAAGKSWPAADRKTWLTMINMAFDLAYGSGETAPPSNKDPLQDVLS